MRIHHINYYALKRKDNEGEGEVEDRVFKRLITPDTKMGFVRGSYLDVYATALAAVIGILIGILLTFYIVGKFIYRKLSKNREEI